MQNLLNMLMSVFLTFFMTSAHAEIYSPKCSVFMAGKSHATLVIRDKKVEILGWDHLDEDEVKVLLKAQITALEKSKLGDCAGAEQTLSGSIRQLSDAYSKAFFIRKALESIHSKAPINKVGLEISPEEWSSGKLPQILAMRKTTGEIKQNCPNVSQEIKKFALVRFGPEYSFVQAHAASQHPPTNLPIESYALRMKNMKDFEGDVFLDLDDMKAKHRDLPGYSVIQKAVFEQMNVPDSAIVQLARNVQDPSAESRIRRDISIWQKRIAGAYLRNEAIVSNLINEQGHVALVIGHRHVGDLVSKMMRACNANEGMDSGERRNSHYSSDVLTVQ